MGLGIGCETFVRGNTSNKNDTRLYIYAFGRVPATGVIKLFRMPAIAPDNNTFELGQYITGERDKNSLYDTTGRQSSTLGNETISERTFSLTFASDTVYNALNPEVLPRTVNRNTMMGILEASGIEDDNVYYEIVGASGNRITCPAVAPLDHKWVLYRDGYLLIDGQKTDATTGEPSLRANPDIETYNKTSKCVMIEELVSPIQGSTLGDQVFRYPFVAFKGATFAEGDDQNTYSVEGMLISDRGHVLDSIVDGFSANEVDTLVTGTGTGTGTLDSDDLVVTGSGTAAFTTELEVGYTITSDGETRTITQILDIDQLIINEAFSADLITKTFTYAGSASTVYKINAKYIIVKDEVSTPTMAGTLGDYVVTIDSDDGIGIVKVYRCTTAGAVGTVVWTGVNNTLGQGFTAWTSEYSALEAGTGGVSGEVHFMAVKTAGASGAAIAGKYGTSYTIPVRNGIVDVVTRTTMFENYTVE